MTLRMIVTGIVFCFVIYLMWVFGLAIVVMAACATYAAQDWDISRQLRQEEKEQKAWQRRQVDWGFALRD